MAWPVIDQVVAVEFVPGSGTYVDLAPRVQAVRIDRPPYSPMGEASAVTCTVDLMNYPDSTTGVSPFMVDNPLSPYYPNVARDRRMKVTVTVGASSYVRFLGWVDTWVPEATDGDPATAMTTLTGSDVIGRYERRRILSVFGEVATQPGGDTNSDYYPFDDDPDSTVLRAVDSGANTARPGQMIPPTTAVPGSAILSSPDGGHLTDGQIDFTRGDSNAPAPVVLIPLRSTLNLVRVSAWFRLTNDPAGSTGDDVVTAYDIAGELLWTFGPKISAGLVTWTLADNAGVAKSFYGTNAPRDDGWHFQELLFPTSASSQIGTADKGQAERMFGGLAWSYDPRQAAWLVVGGRMRPVAPGKQTNTFQGTVSSMILQFGNYYPYVSFGNPALPTIASTVSSYLASTSTDLDALVGGGIGGSSADNTLLIYTNETRTLLDRWNEHCRTTGGILTSRPDGRREYTASASARPTTVAVTLDAEADLHMPAAGWQVIHDERPTRVRVGCPVGSVVVIDTDAEASTSLREEASVLGTAAGSIDVARSAGSWAMSSRGGRLAAFAVDLSLTATDKTVALMALKQGDRMRISGLPSGHMGVTYRDDYAAGWSEYYTGSKRDAVWVFSTYPADDPPEAVFNDAEYGRFAMASGTVTGGTCIGTTTTGTVIITTGSPLTTTGGEYPMDLNWNGERITVSGVGGGTSPQTATVTARGVAPSVARSHATGETINVWHAATFAR